MIRAAAAAAACLLLLSPTAALAADCPRTSLQDISDEVMCLECGVPLNLAEDAPSAKRERVFIQQLVDRCKSKSEVKAALEGQFGDRVLAEPDSGSPAWLVPAIAFAVAAPAIAVLAVRWRRRRRAAPAELATPAPATSDRLQRDIDRYEL